MFRRFDFSKVTSDFWFFLMNPFYALMNCNFELGFDLKVKVWLFQNTFDHLALMDDFLGKFVISDLQLDRKKLEGPGWSFEKWDGKFWGTTEVNLAFDKWALHLFRSTSSLEKGALNHKQGRPRLWQRGSAPILVNIFSGKKGSEP